MLPAYLNLIFFYTCLFAFGFIMFSTLPTNVLQRLRNLVVEEPTSPAPQEASEPNAAPYDPTPIDIVVVRIMLIQSKKLPPDIVDAVFDHAEYWAHSSNEIDYQAEHQSALRIIGSSSVENKFLVSPTMRSSFSVPFVDEPCASFARFQSVSLEYVVRRTWPKYWPTTRMKLSRCRLGLSGNRHTLPSWLTIPPPN